MKKTHSLIGAALLCSVAFASSAFAQNVGQPAGEAGKPNPLKNVYFGEQHMHTSASPDAFAVGTRGTWEDAYDYALGKGVKLSTTGETIRKKTPYDFVAITDHAEYFAVMPQLIDPKDPLSKTDMGKRLQNNDPTAVNDILGDILASTGRPQFLDPKLQKDNWAKYVAAANKANDPGNFTALIAFEWTSIPNGRNMHRNVFFRDDKGPEVPFSAFDSFLPEDLWTYLEIQRKSGTDTFAIPHNGNVSDGWMFSPNKFLAGPMDERYAARQALNEPLFEMIQTKGSSDTHPLLSPNDEFAEFELFENMINVGQPSQITYGYFRQGLAEGFVLEDKLGSNPFKMGIVAGADSHSAYSNNEEFAFHGSHGVTDDTPAKRLNPGMSPSGEPGSVVGTAGVTAVWAEENTRGGIFDAMKSKETYGTSGTMIRLRFFGGWEMPADITSDEKFVEKAYASGVPMGQDMPAHPLKDMAQSPSFAVWALKDPESGNLDRVQVVKSFVNKWGRPGEAVYDVVWSDAENRPVGNDGKVPSVGTTVDIAKATYTNDIGDTQLSAVWTDPDFDPTQKAAYYVRVLEIPTPRWSTYDAARNNLPLATDVPATIQERAWSSPIWYTPSDEIMKMAADSIE